MRLLAADLQNRLYFNNEPVLPEDWLGWYLDCGLGAIINARCSHAWAFRQGTHYHQVTGLEVKFATMEATVAQMKAATQGLAGA